MKPRFIFQTLGLVAALGLSSCASAGTSVPSAPTAFLLGTETPAPATSTPMYLSTPTTLEAATVPPTQVVEVQAIATSRGPNLEATDPTTVSLASGQLQLVEFFRFT